MALPVASFEDLFSAGIKIVVPESSNGTTTLSEQIVLMNLLKQVAPKRIFEFGTFTGRTTTNMVANAPEAIIYTLDLGTAKPKLPLGRHDAKYLRETAGELFRDTEYNGRIIQLYEDSATFDFTRFESYMDFVFVDGAHSLEYVVNDSRAALRMLPAGRGMIVWHDYPEWDGPRKALDELQQKEPRLAGIRYFRGRTPEFREKVDLAFVML